MWSSEVGFNLLQERGRWKVEFFCSPNCIEDNPQHEGLLPIRSLVRERTESIDPKTLGDTAIKYIGLEHIQSLTGELVGFAERPAKEVKSRSKIFRENDVLFGRLRPNLNKVWLARGEVGEGICSTEFLVLVPNTKVVLPMVLRYLLSSKYVQRHALRLQSGTALPRMNRDDLLDIEVPVPPMKIQKLLEEKLQRQFEELVGLRRRVNELPSDILQNFLYEVESA